MKHIAFIAIFALSSSLAFFCLPALGHQEVSACKQVDLNLAKAGFGVNIFIGPKETKDMDLIKKSGLGIVRVDLLWDRIEKYKGEYNWESYDSLVQQLTDRGLRPYFILAYSNSLYYQGLSDSYKSPPIHGDGELAFLKWVASAVNRYKKLNPIWEIWNEPNHKGFWKDNPSSTEYSQFSISVAKVIRTIDPFALIAGPAMAGVDFKYLSDLFSNGSDVFDYISIHPYRLPDSPPEGVIRDLLKVRSLVREKNVTSRVFGVPQVIFGEWGYSTYPKGVGLEKQADFLERSFLIALFNFVPINIWFSWKDGTKPDVRDLNFGMVNNLTVKKPSYIGFLLMSSQLNGFDGFCHKSTEDNLHVYFLYNNSELVKIFIWSVKNDVDYELNIDCKDLLVKQRGKEDVVVNCNGSGFGIKAESAPKYIDVRR